MRPPLTKQPFKHWDQLASIAERLRVFGNSAHLSKFERGLWAEWTVVQHLQKQGLRLWAHRWRTPFAELDLIFKTNPRNHQGNNQRLEIYEVKSEGPHALWEGVLSPQQKQRLLRARLYVEAKSSRPVALHLAVVSHCGEIQIIPDVLC